MWKFPFDTRACSHWWTPPPWICLNLFLKLSVLIAIATATGNELYTWITHCRERSFLLAHSEFSVWLHWTPPNSSIMAKGKTFPPLDFSHWCILLYTAIISNINTFPPLNWKASGLRYRECILRCFLNFFLRSSNLMFYEWGLFVVLCNYMCTQFKRAVPCQLFSYPEVIVEIFTNIFTDHRHWRMSVVSLLANSASFWGKSAVVVPL